MSTQPSGRLLYMVCFKTHPESFQTYWNVYPADDAADADQQAAADGLFKDGRNHHCWTVPYNREGMTPEETYAAHLVANGAAAGAIA